MKNVFKRIQLSAEHRVYKLKIHSPISTAKISFYIQRTFRSDHWCFIKWKGTSMVWHQIQRSIEHLMWRKITVNASRGKHRY